MKQDEIIKLAREAGFLIDGDSWIHDGSVLVDGRKSIDKHLKRFANLVAAHKAEVTTAEAYRCGVEAGAAVERAKCLQIADEFANADLYASMVANAIRSRGDTK